MRFPLLHRFPRSARLLIFSLLLGSAVLPYVPASGSAPPRGAPPFETVLSTHSDRLALVASDAAALALFTDGLAAALNVADTLSVLASSAGRSRATPAPPDVRTPALALVKALARWDRARRLRGAAQARDLRRLGEGLAPDDRRNAWLHGGDAAGALDRAVRLASVVTVFAERPPSPSPPPPEELARDAARDQRYPHLVDHEDSWVEVALRDGLSSVLDRLNDGDGRSEPAATPGPEAVRYFQSRLLSVFLAQIVAETIRVESEARRGAALHWERLATWRETWSTARGLARLCGTWQWVIHNHQNHQDHKTVVTFPPPEAERTGPAMPARVSVLGDSVYLRWEFPGGFQEDSLLFSGRDRRLEGTFVNSQGPHGAITGKRVRPCESTR